MTHRTNRMGAFALLALGLLVLPAAASALTTVQVQSFQAGSENWVARGPASAELASPTAEALLAGNARSMTLHVASSSPLADALLGAAESGAVGKMKLSVPTASRQSAPVELGGVRVSSVRSPTPRKAVFSIKTGSTRLAAAPNNPAINPLGNLTLKRGTFYTMTRELQSIFERPNCGTTRLPSGQFLKDVRPPGGGGVSEYNCTNNGTCTCHGAYDCVQMIAAHGVCQEGTVGCNSDICTCNESGTQCPFDDCPGGS